MLSAVFLSKGMQQHAGNGLSYLIRALKMDKVSRVHLYRHLSLLYPFRLHVGG
jgi:hypothetical protein